MAQEATSWSAHQDKGRDRRASGNADHRVDDWFAALRPRGRLCVVGLPTEPITVSPLSVIPAEKSLVSAGVGPPAVTRRLLGFAARHGSARHGIHPEVEVFPSARIDEAIDHVRQGRARYRTVVDLRTSG